MSTRILMYTHSWERKKRPSNMAVRRLFREPEHYGGTWTPVCVIRRVFPKENVSRLYTHPEPLLSGLQRAHYRLTKNMVTSSTRTCKRAVLVRNILARAFRVGKPNIAFSCAFSFSGKQKSDPIDLKKRIDCMLLWNAMLPVPHDAYDSIQTRIVFHRRLDAPCVVPFEETDRRIMNHGAQLK